MIAEKIIAVLKKDAITAVRYRNGFVLSSLVQVAQLATFYYLARAVGRSFRPKGMPYFLFLLIGTGFYTFLLSGIHKLPEDGAGFAANRDPRGAADYRDPGGGAGFFGRAFGVW